MKKPNLRDMTLEELEAFIAGMGKERYRARQIMKWLYNTPVESFAEMTTLSRPFREQMEIQASLDQPEIAGDQVSRDGTKKRRAAPWAAGSA
jgi:23S rRNA (adenine2503-C2)-methyltransferase